MRKYRIFTLLKENVTSYLQHLVTKPVALPTEELELQAKLTNRYNELFNDPLFQKNVAELAYLENILMQRKALSRIEPVLYYQPNGSGNRRIYARLTFPQRKYANVVLTKSLGDANAQPKNLNQLSHDPLFMVGTQKKLKEEMLKRSDLEEYLIRYPQML